MKLAKPFLIFSLAVIAPLSPAASIFQWVDDQGRVQFSDTVPERYKSKAKELDVQRFKPAPQPTSASPAQATPDTAGATPTVSDLPPGFSAAPRALTAPSPPRASAAPVKADCATLRRRYADSQRCFAPFITVFGSVKAEAFEKCTPVPDPSRQCGVPRLP